MTLATLESGTLAAGAAGLLYALTVSGVALTAALSREPGRRRAARDVLVILLRRHDS
jgi:hypothetical protein